MLKLFTQLSRARKLENSIFLLIVLFVFKIIFPANDTIPVLIINEIIILLAIFFIIAYTDDFIRDKIDSPIAIVLNTGILNAVLFFIISLSSAIFEEPTTLIFDADFIVTILITLFAFVFIGSLTYIFSGFRSLFYMREKKELKSSFNLMMIAILLAAISNALVKIEASLEYIYNTFYVISIIFISFNSLRVAWIAFLVKKQKLYLLLISVVLSALFAFNFALIIGDVFVVRLIGSFSPSLLTFLNLIMLYGLIYFGVIFFTTLFHLPTASAFDRKAEEVSSLIDLSKLITQVFDFKELADTITKMTTNVSNSDSAWLVTLDDNNFELTSIHNIGYLDADEIIKSLDWNVFQNTKGVSIIKKGYIIKGKGGDLKKLKYDSIAVAPLKVHNTLSGYLLAGRKDHFEFDEDDKKSIGAFADYAAVALENAKLFKESIEKERLEKELDVAREIQYKILPDKNPQCETLKISSLFIPAFEVGGDYYDFFKLEENKLGFVIADVSGKGISAAFIMAEVKGIFETLSRLVQSPKELLTLANEILKNSLDSKTFVTAIYGIFDTLNGKLLFSRVGHTPLHMLRNGSVIRLVPSGIGLGLDYSDKFNDSIKEMEIEFINDDILVFYTDGVTEAQNENNEDFGYDRLDRILVENSGKKIEDISNEIMKDITVFSKNNAQHDDITMVIFKWNFSINKNGEN
jgi:serine phosphatase RsbU (regulator of sigma subunit)